MLSLTGVTARFYSVVKHHQWCSCHRRGQKSIAALDLGFSCCIAFHKYTQGFQPNACTKLVQAQPNMLYLLHTCSCNAIRTQEVYTLLIMKLIEHIYRPIPSKCFFACPLPENSPFTILQFDATLHCIMSPCYLGGVPSSALQYHLPNVLDLLASKQ